MELTVAGTAEATSIGLHEADGYDSVLDVERCLPQPDALNALLEETRRDVRAHHLRAWDAETGAGLLRFVMLRAGLRTGEAMVNIVACAPEIETLAPLAERLRARLPGTVSVVLNCHSRKASVAVGTEEHLLAGRDHINESLSGLTFH